MAEVPGAVLRLHLEEQMRVLITLAGGSSSIEGDVKISDMQKIADLLSLPNQDFIVLDNTPYGEVIVNKSAISYIRRKQ